MSRIVVTGGSGFIGGHLVDTLKEDGHEVVVVDHRIRPHRNDVIFEDVDLLDMASLIEATKGSEYIFHLAAVSNVNYALKYPAYTVDVNIKGSVNVLESARFNKIKRVFFASTVWVYTGARREKDLTEDEPFYLSDAGHIYTTTKIATEMIIHNYFKLYKLPFTILRYGIPYGPRMREELVIPIFVRKAFNKEKLTIQGDGRQFRNYIYIDDLIRAHTLAMKPVAENQTYNLEGEEKITVKQIAETIKNLVGKYVEIEYIPARQGDYYGKIVSNQKAKKEIGWSCEISFEEGMKRYIEWYRTNLSMNNK